MLKWFCKSKKNSENEDWEIKSTKRNYNPLRAKEIKSPKFMLGQKQQSVWVGKSGTHIC